MENNEIFGHHNDTADFSMVVADVFTIDDLGIVATGRVRTGSLNINDDNTILICNKGSIVEGYALYVEMFKKLFDECEYGDNIGLILPFSAEGYVGHGTLICSKDFAFSAKGGYYCNHVKTETEPFKDVQYHDRQFVFVIKDSDDIGKCYDPSNTINFVFPLNELPKDISFPFGHPQPNTLYYAHPLKPYYIPVEEANLTLFYERIQELSRLLQCLGATSVTLRCLKGKSVTEGNKNSRQIGVEGSYMAYSAEGSYGATNDTQSFQSRENEMSEEKHFNPTVAPYCPDDLVWAAMDSDLHLLVDQRLNGGLLHFSKKVSTKETMNVSSSRLTDVKAAFGCMVAKVSANYNSENDSTFCESNETLWEISAEFKPMEEFSNPESSENKEVAVANTASSVSPAEQEYIDEYCGCLANGEISPLEVRLLNKIAKGLGISESRARELEQIAKSSKLTDAEREYLKEYRACLEEAPELSSTARRLLKRIATSLNLNDEQVARLEQMSH
ncbi:MAG: hypothetical protein NC453_28080 [Muribaculum sp.]|nr:hypothetical protein [Muribaculum sp.]